jgi:hypothetical protein
MAATATAQLPLTIEAGKVYPLSEFVRITRFGRHAMRQARRRGLKVRYTGNRAFISGDDFISFLDGLDAKGHAS